MNKKKALSVILIMVLCFCFLMTSCADKDSPKKTALTFGTMQAGTSTYAVGAALAAVWNDHLDYTITQQPMQVTGLAFRLLKQDELDLAVTTVWAMHGAYSGEDPFWDTWELSGIAPVPINQLCTGSAMAYGFFTTDPGIKTLKDMEGKRVYITQPGAESDIQVKALLQAAGVDYSKITDVPFSSIDEAKQGLKEGRAVAVYWTVSAWIQDVATTKPMYTVNISRGEVDRLNELLPGWGFVYADIEKGAQGLSSGGSSLAVPFGIYVREGLDEQVVYDLTKTMYEFHDEAVNHNPQYLGAWSLDRALMAIGAPIHPGAVRYYREAGVWDAQAEAANNSLLTMERRVK